MPTTHPALVAARQFTIVTLAWLMLLASLEAASPLESVRGMPFIRFYSFEEIGQVTHASRLSFDPSGRIAIMHEGNFVVLNDSVWISRAEDKPDGARVLQAVTGADGTVYFGGLGIWGVVSATDSGRLRAVPSSVESLPAWVLATNFVEIICQDRGVFFAGWGGVVYWDRVTRQHQFFEFGAVARIFEVGGSVYASSHAHGVRRVEPGLGLVEDTTTSAFTGFVPDQIVALDDEHLLVSTTARQLMLVQGGSLAPWNTPFAQKIRNRITRMIRLTDDHIAIAVSGMGVYILAPNGEIRAAITSPDHHRVTDLAQNEPGVLWIAADRGVSKVLYGSPVSLVGQPLGLPVSWPQLARWQKGLVIASAGRLYEPAPVPADLSFRLQLVAGQPDAGTWALAVPSDGSELLVGNINGVFVTGGNGRFERVVRDMPVARLVMTGSDRCFVVGAEEIGVLQRGPDGWFECAPRVPGLGYPYIVHASRNAAWLELGANRAARLALREGRIDTRVFDTFPWEDLHWINVSVIGDTVMLAGPAPHRLYFDEREEKITHAAHVEDLMAQAPYTVVRLRQDEEGTYWASHYLGILTARHEEGGFKIDDDTFGIVAELAPLVQILPGNDIWLSTGQALYHVDRSLTGRATSPSRPVLVSLMDRRSHEELLAAPGVEFAPRDLPYARNSLELTFFAGGYGTRRTPSYEVRLNREAWSPLGPSASSLTLSALREGHHTLDVRLVDSRGRRGEPISVSLRIRPPWYRSWYSYSLYAGAILAFFFGLVRLSLRRAQARNLELEVVVAERTQELTAAMTRLQHETEISATLAERNRLADEIHDSLEQGFTGLTFQLETTAGFPSCPPEVRAGLDVALDMAAYSRDEVRNAVRNLHSPMLDSGGLVAALHLLAAQGSYEPGYISVHVQGEARRLDSTLEHHLLRIAQEAVANTVKHAAARHVRIDLGFELAGLTLSISDDGRGFDVSAAERRTTAHFGLPSMRSRAGKVGGTLTINSQIGQGTQISIHVIRPPSPHP